MGHLKLQEFKVLYIDGVLNISGILSHEIPKHITPNAIYFD